MQTKRRPRLVNANKRKNTFYYTKKIAIVRNTPLLLSLLFTMCFAYCIYQRVAKF